MRSIFGKLKAPGIIMLLAFSFQANGEVFKHKWNVGYFIGYTLSSVKFPDKWHTGSPEAGAQLSGNYRLKGGFFVGMNFLLSGLDGDSWGIIAPHVGIEFYRYFYTYVGGGYFFVPGDVSDFLHGAQIGVGWRIFSRKNESSYFFLSVEYNLIMHFGKLKVRMDFFGPSNAPEWIDFYLISNAFLLGVGMAF